MTEQEWIKEAERYEAMAQQAYERGDEVAGELWERNAQSCRHNSCYGTVSEE
jgi:hypothetical protein